VANPVVTGGVHGGRSVARARALYGLCTGYVRALHGL